MATPASGYSPPKVKDLPRKPLVEALLEVRWKLEKRPNAVEIDPGYPIAAGRLYDRIKAAYPVVDQLPAASIPDQITAQVVKYRFRAGKNAWPVAQLGPGIATINFTDSYSWDRFRSAAIEFVPNLLAAYDGIAAIQATSVLARYINAIEFDPSAGDVLTFLREQMHTQLELPGGIAGYEHKDGFPSGINLQVSQPLSRPKGVGTLLVGTGERVGKPTLIWELHVHSQNQQAPSLSEGFEDWLDQAHAVIESWFFTLVEGPLYKQFGGGG